MVNKVKKTETVVEENWQVTLKKFCSLLFSDRGVLGGWQFFGVYCLLSMSDLLVFLGWICFAMGTISALLWWVLLYATIRYLWNYGVMAAIQKRCRDFGSKGTWYLLLFMVHSIFPCLLLFSLELYSSKAYYVNYFLLIFHVIYWVAFIYLVSTPAVEEKNMELRSPLLKCRYSREIMAFFLLVLMLLAVLLVNTLVRVVWYGTF